MTISFIFCQYAPGGELFDYIVAKDKLKVRQHNKVGDKDMNNLMVCAIDST